MINALITICIVVFLVCIITGLFTMLCQLVMAILTTPVWVIILLFLIVLFIPWEKLK
jgi:hypothetical protein